MAQSYAAIPQGGLYNIPEALPQGLLYRYKKISNISRQNHKIPPNNGQGDVWAGQKIIVTLPSNALIDLSTFTMYFKVYTIDSSQSEREFRNLAAPRFPENHGVTIIIEF